MPARGTSTPVVEALAIASSAVDSQGFASQMWAYANIAQEALEQN